MKGGEHMGFLDGRKDAVNHLSAAAGPAQDTGFIDVGEKVAVSTASDVDAPDQPLATVSVEIRNIIELLNQAIAKAKELKSLL
jgi:hypothetical protein